MPSSIQIQRRFHSTVARLHQRKRNRADTLNRAIAVSLQAQEAGVMRATFCGDDLLFAVALLFVIAVVLLAIV